MYWNDTDGLSEYQRDADPRRIGGRVSPKTKPGCASESELFLGGLEVPSLGFVRAALHIIIGVLHTIV